MTSLAPTLLIAVPQLLDPNFRRSVVLLLQQSDEGALGVVVNHETPLLLRDLCRDQSIDYSGDPKKHVRRGGPVQPENGLVLFGPEHVDPADPEDRQVLNGLHVSASRETLHRLCKLPRGRFHCYAGYAGWAPEQLEQEIGAGSWITAPVKPSLVLDATPDDVWLESLKSVGIDPAALVSPPGGIQA